EIHLARPRAPCRDGREGRHHLQRARRGAGLVDESKLPLIHGIGAQADAVRIKHHFAIGVAVFLAEVLQRHQLFVVDRHRWFFSGSPSANVVGWAKRSVPTILLVAAPWWARRVAPLPTLRNPSDRREEWQRGAVGRLEHQLDLLS